MLLQISTFSRTKGEVENADTRKKFLDTFSITFEVLGVTFIAPFYPDLGNEAISTFNCEQLVRNQSRLKTSNQDRDFSTHARADDDLDTWSSYRPDGATTGTNKILIHKITNLRGM